MEAEVNSEMAYLSYLIKQTNSCGKEQWDLLVTTHIIHNINRMNGKSQNSGLWNVYQFIG